jgi:hypothetical protein
MAAAVAQQAGAVQAMALLVSMMVLTMVSGGIYLDVVICLCKHAMFRPIARVAAAELDCRALQHMKMSAA